MYGYYFYTFGIKLIKTIMKATLLAIMFFALVSCNEAKKDDPGPTYSSLVGKWAFTGKSISGNFEVVESSGVLSVTTDGYYVFAGVSNKFSKKGDLSIDGVKIKQLYLYGERGSFLVFSEGGEYSSDFKTMTFKSYYGTDNVVVVETITIERPM